MPSVTLTRIRQVGSRYYFRFGKINLSFESLSDAQAWANEQLSAEDMMALAIKMAFTRQPDLNNPSALEGRTLNIDLTVNNFGTIT